MFNNICFIEGMIAELLCFNSMRRYYVLVKDRRFLARDSLCWGSIVKFICAFLKQISSPHGHISGTYLGFIKHL